MFKRIFVFIAIAIVFIGAFVEATNAQENALELTEAEETFIDKHPVVYYAPDPNFPPFEFWFNETAIGIVPDYLEIIESKTGLVIEPIRFESWSEVLSAIEDKKADIVFASESDERKSSMLFTDVVVKVPNAMIVRENGPATLNINRLEGYRIGVIVDYQVSKLFTEKYPNYTTVEYLDGDLLTKAVSFGEVDVAIINLGLASHSIEKQRLTNLRVAGEVLIEPNISFGIRKDYPELQSIINKALSSMSDQLRTQLEDEWIRFQILSFWKRPFVLESVGILTLLMIATLFWIALLRSEVKRQSKAILESKNLLETIVDHVPHIIYVRDQQGNYVMVNQSTADYYGKKKETLIGKNIYELKDSLSEKEKNELVERDRFVAQSDQFLKIDQEKIYDVSGKLTIYSVVKRAIKFPENKDFYTLTVAMDITETVESQAELANQEIALRTAEVALADLDKKATLGSLVGGITHEINNPIGVSVTALSHLMSEFNLFVEYYAQGKLTQSLMKEHIDTTKETLDILQININRAVEMITSFKSMSVDQLSGTRLTFNLVETINHVTHSLSHELKRKNAKVRLILPEVVVIDSYPGSYSQVLTNLIMNSLIHGFDKSQNGLITIEANVIDENLEIHYRDNGIGMNEELLEKVWQPYFTTKRDKGGSGLGMQIIYNIVVRVLKGHVTFSSQLNQGVYCYISVPKKL